MISLVLKNVTNIIGFIIVSLIYKKGKITHTILNVNGASHPTVSYIVIFQIKQRSCFSDVFLSSHSLKFVSESNKINITQEI